MSRNTKIAILKNKIKIDLDTPYIQEKGDLEMLHRVMIKATPLHDVAGRVDYQERRKTPRFSHGDIRRKIHTLFTE